MEPMATADASGVDRVLHFTIPKSDIRGRLVRIGPVLDLVQSAHDYPPPVRALLAESLVLAALMGSLLKDQDSQLTIQAQAEGGIVDMLVCDYRNGELRGYVRHDPDRLAQCEAEPTLSDFFGRGYLAVTFDLAATGQRYQGIVPLEGESLADACQAYFVQSEQVPTLIKMATTVSGANCVGAGMLIQHLPDGEEGRERLHAQMDHPHWEHIAILSQTLKAEELTDLALMPTDLIWRLYHDEGEVRFAQDDALTRGCRCSEAHYRAILNKFAEADLAEMRDEQGAIMIDCAFCSKLFPIFA
jgi:molecular chaperone Hsp33